MPAYPGFLGPSYQSASTLADSERLINWMLEPNESPTAPSKFVLLPTPGMTTFASVASSPIRAGISIPDPAGERNFFVSGFGFYELLANGTTILRGSITSDANPATISWDGPTGGHLFITSGGVGYGYTLATNTLTANITSLPATMGAFLSDRFLALDATTSTLQASNQLSTTFNPTMVAVRSLAADPWIAMTVSNGLIYLWGQQTGEAWYDAGAFPFPFQWQQGAFWEQGIAAPFSASRTGSPIQWIGQNKQGARVIWQMDGFTPNRVSTHGIEQILASYATVADATSLTYQDRGHLFYVPTFPTGGQTWALDVTLGSAAGWGERGFWNTQTGSWEPWRLSTMWYGFGGLFAGDRKMGTIYRVSPTSYTDVNGQGMRRLRQPPRLSFNQSRVRYNRLQLVMDVGIGLASGQGVDPQIMLRSSRDGGHTYGPERWQSAGQMGAYDTRVFWTRLGASRNRVDQIIVSDPVPVRITEALLDYAPGVN